ncbi:competence protein CoiA family protein (plasmid) [Streptomyces sp. NBC_01544]|uniref:competence protein CoiA family protein n=1 Tax=Streptomyces sp. NBC_01544 TaxID=2975871 RepID=UPI002F913017
MIRVMGRSAWDTESRTTIWVDDGVGGLPPGMAEGRYLCRACREKLILKGTRTGSKVQPYFAHRGGAGCSRSEKEALLDAADEVVIRLREQIRALPGVTGCTTASPGENHMTPSLMPSAVLAQFGTTTVVIEAPTATPLGTEAIRRRIQAVREEHAGAQHVWFLRRDLDQFHRLAPHPVWLRGKTTLHEQVAPNEQQLVILAGGGHVYWLDGKAVLVPYGILRFRHPVQRDQDWANWRRWKSDPRDDWRISKPRPAPDAHTWGLVPIAFSSLTRTRGTFRPADAYQVMDELYAAQESRFKWRNQHAREVYAAATPPARAESEAEPVANDPEPLESGQIAADAIVPSPLPQEPEAELSARAASESESDVESAEMVIPAPPAHPPYVPPAPAPAPPAAQVATPRLWQRLLRFARRDD